MVCLCVCGRKWHNNLVFSNRVQAVRKAQSRVTCWPMLAGRKEMQKVEQRPCQAEVSIKPSSQPLDWEEPDWDHAFDEMKPLTWPYRRFISGNGAIIKRSCGLRSQKHTLRTHTSGTANEQASVGARGGDSNSHLRLQLRSVLVFCVLFSYFLPFDSAFFFSFYRFSSSSS